MEGVIKSSQKADCLERSTGGEHPNRTATSLEVCRLKIPQPRIGDVGLDPAYAIEEADWIWHPHLGVDEPAFLQFQLDFDCGPDPFEIEVSADQRFELTLDGAWIGAGPEVSDPRHWSFSRYRIEASPGKHSFKAFVWWLGQKAPFSRMSHRPGFVLAGRGVMAPVLDTGKTRWRVRQLLSHKTEPQEDFEGRFLGDSLFVDATIQEGPWVRAIPVPIIRARPHVGSHGNAWRMFPADLKDQRSDTYRGGRIHSVLHSLYREDEPWPSPAMKAVQVGDWQSLLSEGVPCLVRPFSSLSVLWDFGDYICGYPQLEVANGKGSTIRWDWAESLYSEPMGEDKGDRNEVRGKYFRGFGDRVRCAGQEMRFRGHWWKSGRYVLLRIETADQALEIRDMSVRRTGYPWVLESTFRDKDGSFAPLIEICRKGLLNCSHETLTDCPYYEQLMYAGDSRIEALIGYTHSHDDRVARRSMELFDFSRSNAGFCSARFPSRNQVDIPTFSMSWVWMLHDYLFWRDDPEWLRQRIPGMRAVIAAFCNYLNPDGFLENLPGWNFVDWASGWVEGAAPCAEEVSVIVNLQFLMTLSKLAELENEIGDPLMAEWARLRADQLAQRLRERFWNPQRGVFEETSPGMSNQHSQILAILSGCFSPEMEEKMVLALAKDPSLTPTTLYFRHYLFEAFFRTGRIDLLKEGFGFWDYLINRGLLTPIERHEPSRSDCHAWSSHPLFHLFGSILGIRPVLPRFQCISIKPDTRGMGCLDAEMPHPCGSIRFHQSPRGKTLSLSIQAPPSIPLSLNWYGEIFSSDSGSLKIEVA